MKNPVEILDIEFDGSEEAIVTWQWAEGGVPITSRIFLDWQPAEYDVGIMSSGFIADGDAPDEVLDKVAIEATEHQADRYEDTLYDD